MPRALRRRGEACEVTARSARAGSAGGRAPGVVAVGVVAVGVRCGLGPVHLDDARVEVDRPEPPPLAVARLAGLRAELAAREHLAQHTHLSHATPGRRTRQSHYARPPRTSRTG